METRANYALIGAFTLAVIAAGFLFVFWFSRASTSEGRVNYQVLFTTSVSGLSRGSQVLFNGVRVGEVVQVELKPDDPTQVVALITVSARTPVKVDTGARLEYQGLTGVAAIALTGGSATAAALVSSEQKPAIINADRSELQNIMETVQRLSGRMDGILDKADKLLAENTGPIASTVKNVETFSKALADNSDGVKSFMSAMSDVGTTIKPLIANLDERVKAVDPERVRQIVANADQISAKLNNTADKFDKVLTSLDGFLSGGDSKGLMVEIGDAAKSIRKLADNLDVRTKELTVGINRFTGPGLRQYEALASDGRKTLEEVNRTLRSLEKNPQQLLFGSKPTIPEYSGR
jgi:phospholipid/cholesterol/gamma-HCH transport system substrate-binding protein